MKQRSIVVEMKGITKRFPGVVANDNIDFKLKAGEIHALLGENGAGKTTLMNILYGLYTADSGEILVKGQRAGLKCPRDAIDLGIGMIHQHFTLVPPLSVTENITLGLKSSGFLLNPNQVKNKILELSRKYGLKVDPEALIWQLSVGEQQRVEILKALYKGAEILILDEPTAVLTPQETAQLFKTLRRMKKEGKSIVFISHKLGEVLEISDRITVLRKGKIVSTVNADQTNNRELAKMMVGREVIFRLAKHKVKKGSEVLKVENLSAIDDRGVTALKNVSFSVHAGEILGIAGVAGNGQKELTEVLMGIREPMEGRVFISARDVTNASPRELLELEVGYIPEDRIESGLIMDLSVAENLASKVYSAFSNEFFLDYELMGEYAERLISEYDIATPSKESPVKTLSGGNLQKLILARELALEPKLIIASQPTRGLDVGATEFIRRKLLEQKENGTAVLLISEDLGEILTLSDRIAVIYEGEIMGISPVEKTNIEEIGLMMAGTRKASAKKIQGD